MDLIEAGYFSKAHGIKGALILKNQIDFNWEDLKVLFLEVAGGKAPYFVSSISKANQGFIVQLEDVDQIEKANYLLSKKIFIDALLLVEEEVENVWQDFDVIDKLKGRLGKVQTVSDNGSQKILEVEHKGKMVLLPFVDDLIERIDEGKKIIYYKAPAGLIDLYLEEDEGLEENEG